MVGKTRAAPPTPEGGKGVLPTLGTHVSLHGLCGEQAGNPCKTASSSITQPICRTPTVFAPGNTSTQMQGYRDRMCTGA